MKPIEKKVTNIAMSVITIVSIASAILDFPLYIVVPVLFFAGIGGGRLARRYVERHEEIK